MTRYCTAFDCDHTGSPDRLDDPRCHCDVRTCENWWKRCPVHQDGRSEAQRMLKGR